MKKAVSLLIALAAACSMLTVGFAADSIDSDTGIASYLEWAPGSTDDNELVTVQEGDLVLALGASRIVRPETHLTPGNEYTFEIHRVTATTPNAGLNPDEIETVQLTEGALAGGRLRIRSAKGSSTISSVNVKKRGSGVNALYRLEIETRSTYGTNMTDVEYSFVVTGQDTTAAGYVPLNTSTFTFEVGFKQVDDDDIDQYEEGDTVYVDQEYPVYTKKQLETLAKNFNFKPVEFESDDGDWRFTGRISGMGSTNFVTSYDVIPGIINALPDNEFKFLTFNAGVTFPTNGEMRIDVADISEDYDTIYTYLYRNGSLTPISTTYDPATDEIVFRTNYLGAFIMTDTQITDEDLLTDEEDDKTPDENNNNNNNGGNTSNPDTGASAAANVAAALGLATLATAGIVIRKRK